MPTTEFSTKTLMRTLVNLKVDPHLVQWIGAALLKQKVALHLGCWASQHIEITPGLPQGSALSPVLCNVYTIGITSNQLEGPGRVLNFADDVLVYRQGKNRQRIEYWKNSTDLNSGVRCTTGNCTQTNPVHCGVH
ncbi:uncharacterized protein LOC106012672 [Aplysia californica]|uniref:Uncharacterized protein LOC106012672 n=1 Tax=Aplysia californica TaxID=6500 RepID=A0ABM1A6H8_APLCA|nr:uncharacterized protein LOC106012672 [Aplysia californica]